MVLRAYSPIAIELNYDNEEDLFLNEEDPVQPDTPSANVSSFASSTTNDSNVSNNSMEHLNNRNNNSNHEDVLLNENDDDEIGNNSNREDVLINKNDIDTNANKNIFMNDGSNTVKAKMPTILFLKFTHDSLNNKRPISFEDYKMKLSKHNQKNIYKICLREEDDTGSSECLIMSETLLSFLLTETKEIENNLALQLNLNKNDTVYQRAVNQNQFDSKHWKIIKQDEKFLDIAKPNIQFLSYESYNGKKEAQDIFLTLSTRFFNYFIQKFNVCMENHGSKSKTDFKKDFIISKVIENGEEEVLFLISESIFKLIIDVVNSCNS